MPPTLASLRTELRIAGVFEHRELRSWGKLAVLTTALVGCFAGIALLGWVGLFLLVPIGIISTAIAMFGHEGSHRSFSASPARNTFLVYLVFPLFSGLSGLYWRHKHDQLHHGHPNVDGVDPDIQPFPFASSRAGHERSTPGQRWFQRNFQRHLFWPMATLMALGMRRSSIIYLASCRERYTAPWWSEVACLVGHYVLWAVVPSLIWGPLVGIGVYLAVWAIVGVCLALVFAPAHMGLPIVAEQSHDWIHQLETTRNLEMPRFVSYFFIGLDYQVEHHLFPKIPHAHLPRAAAITSAWCKQHGVVYHSMPYPEALVDAARFMADAWDREAMVPEVVRLAS